MLLLQNTGERNEVSVSKNDKPKAVALLQPNTHIIEKAAFLCGIVPDCENGDLPQKVSPKIPNKYTPIVYILEDVSPEKKPDQVEINENQEAVVDLTGVTPVKTHKEKHISKQEKPVHKPLKSYGLSGFGNFTTTSLQQNAPCE